MTETPWGQLFGLLFMTMGPIRAVAVFGGVGESDGAPGVRGLALRSAGLVAAAFVLAVLIGNGALNAWGVSFPVLVGAGGVALFALSLQTLLQPPVASARLDPERTPAAAIAFPGLLPPIAVVVPLIFSAAFPGLGTKLGILALGLGIVVANGLLTLKAKTIMRAVGPAPLQLFGAVFGVLQLALGLQFMLNAAMMIAWDRVQ